MLCVLCVLFSFCAVPLNTTAPCCKWEVNGKVYWIIIIELKDPHSGSSRRGTAQGGEGVLAGGCSYYIKNMYQIYFIKRDQIHVYIYIFIYFINMITRKGENLKCEAKHNIHIDFVWFIDLGNPDYPHLGKRASDGTLEPWNQKKWKVPQ